MESLPFDPNSPFDVTFFDHVVDRMVRGTVQEISEATRFLAEFEALPHAWVFVDKILRESTNVNSKILALGVLDKLIKFRWKTLPREQAEAIRDFIVNIVIELSSNAQTLRTEQEYLARLNLIIVQIVKQEWPTNWKSFISDMVSSAKCNVSLCENNMQILKLLSEEVFDFSSGQIISNKIAELKQIFQQDFGQIFQLCDFILNSKETFTESLYHSTLDTFLRFLNWIPIQYVFKTDLINVLTSKFLMEPVFRNETLACLTEIASIHFTEPSIEFTAEMSKTENLRLFQGVMDTITKILPLSIDFAVAFERSTPSEQVFFNYLGLFFTTIFTNHLLVLEEANQQLVLVGHEYLCKISFINDKEIFKSCLEYWFLLAKDLYNDRPKKEYTSILNLNNDYYNTNNRRSRYVEILNMLRVIIIEKMAKPEEVLLTEDETGQVIRVVTDDTEVTALYKTMKDCLVYLTHLDAQATQSLMLARLGSQAEGNAWERKKLNTLCWAIGSISGAMSEEMEKKLVIAVIKELLGLVEKNFGKDNKAAIAANIMYICGQYPRFLRAHWKFLKTVANKLFEFMHEKHPGVQDMACDTFLKLATKCRRRFVVINPGEERAYIETILTNLPSILYDLSPSQIASFYQSLGIIISAHSDPFAREKLVSMLMEQPNKVWKNIVNSAKIDINSLSEPEIQKSLIHILRTNVAACKSLENNYLSQLKRIYHEMLSFYKLYSEAITAFIESEKAKGKPQNFILQNFTMKTMRAIKQEILKLMDVFISKCLSPSDVYTTFVPTLLSTILTDYKNAIPENRDPQVLALVDTTIEKMKKIMSGDIGGIFACVFEETLSMITKNFEDFPEHRYYFFLMIKAIIEFCFDSLFSLSSAQFKLVFDSIVWAFKHTERNVSETGLKTLLDLLTKISNNPQIAQQFFPVYYFPVLNDVFFVLTDSLHKSGFKTQFEILRLLIFVAHEFPFPLRPIEGQQPPSNTVVVADFVFQMITKAFPNKTPSELHSYVTRMMDPNSDLLVLLQDLVITLKEFSASDELFRDAKELERVKAEAELKKQKEFEERMAIPGLVKPSDLPDMDD